MKSIVAFEDYEENFVPQDFVPGEDTGDAFLLDPQKEAEEEREARREVEHLGEAIDAVEALDGITERLGGEDSICAPMSQGSGDALMVAVEAICSSKAFAGIEFKRVAFEEFSTRKQQLKVSQEAFEKIREVGVKVWEYIVAAFKRLVEFFKKICQRDYWKNKFLKERVRSAEDVADELKKNRGPKKTKPNYPKTKPGAANDGTSESGRAFGSMRLRKVLHRGGKVPLSVDLCVASNDHSKLMADIFKSIRKKTEAFLRDFEAAIAGYNKFDNSYENHLKQALAEMSWTHFPRKAANQEQLGKLGMGVSLYEQPLIFGDMSAYNVAVSSAANINTDDLKFVIAPFDRAAEVDVEQELRPLDLNEVETILSTLSFAETRTKLNIDATFHHTKHMEGLLRKLEAIKAKNTAERNIKRATMLHKTLMIFMGLSRGMLTEANRYDFEVREALQEFCDRSLSKMKTGV